MHSSLSGDIYIAAVLAGPMEGYEAGCTAAPSANTTSVLPPGTTAQAPRTTAPTRAAAQAPRTTAAASRAYPRSDTATTATASTPVEHNA